MTQVSVMCAQNDVCLKSDYPEKYLSFNFDKHLIYCRSNFINKLFEIIFLRCLRRA